MAINRDRLAAVLAYQAEKRRRLADYVPTIDQTEPVRPSSAGLGTNLENLSAGIGQGIVNQLEGVKSLVTDPVGTTKAAYEGVKGVVRNPAVLAEALRQTGQKAMSGPLGAGEVIGEMVSPMRGKPSMMEMGDVIDARQTRAGRNLPDLEAELAAKNLTIQPNEKGGFDVYGRKVGFDPAIPQKLTTVKEGGRAAAIQAAKNIGRKTDAELQAAKTRNPFSAYAEFGNLDDYIADRPDLLEKLTRKKLVSVEPEIESVQPSFKNKNYRVRFKTGEEFSVENVKPETLDELKATVRKDLYSEQIPDQLQGKTVKDLISTLAWQERSEKYIKDVLSGKKRLRLDD
jgi:hypothetical protein